MFNRRKRGNGDESKGLRDAFDETSRRAGTDGGGNAVLGGRLSLYEYQKGTTPIVAQIEKPLREGVDGKFLPVCECGARGENSIGSGRTVFCKDLFFD